MDPDDYIKKYGPEALLDKIIRKTACLYIIYDDACKTG